MAKRTCTGTTKRGTACKGPPLKNSKQCLAHQDHDVKVGAGFGGAQPGAGRPRSPRALDLARRLVEEQAHELLRPYLRTLGLNIDDAGELYRDGPGAIHIGRDKEGGVFASDIEDLGAQINAAERLFDRVLGRPRQALEHTGEGGNPITVAGGAMDLRKLTDDELDELRELTERVRDRLGRDHS